MNRPETRIIKQQLWGKVQTRVVATSERYSKKAGEQESAANPCDPVQSCVGPVEVK